MILQSTTEKELLTAIDKIQKSLIDCQAQNKLLTKKVDLLQGEVNKKPTVLLKETIIKEAQPVINNVTQGVTSADVLLLITKHVTMPFINKLYKKKGKK
tara:strand:- start:137 stop:433 length:297 start_codon:yes stop_codon:yes gene_type:complete